MKDFDSLEPDLRKIANRGRYGGSVPNGMYGICNY